MEQLEFCHRTYRTSSPNSAVRSLQTNLLNRCELIRSDDDNLNLTSLMCHNILTNPLVLLLTIINQVAKKLFLVTC